MMLALERVGLSAGTMQMVGELGSIVGPLVGTVLLSIYPARLVLPVMGLLILVGVCFVLFGMTEPVHSVQVIPQQSFTKDWSTLGKTVPFPQLMLASFFINFALVGTNPILPFYVNDSSNYWWNSTQSAGFHRCVSRVSLLPLFTGSLGCMDVLNGCLPVMNP